MKKGLKIFIVAMSLVLVIATAVGTTLALLTAKTTTITNTFTIGKIEISLDETERTYKLVPGAVLDKDPTVTVKSGSEACYLFVKIDKQENLDLVTYEIADGWTLLETGVYYRTVAATNADTPFEVLKDNKVYVSINATSTDLTAAKGKTLSFTAYACQKEYVDTAAQAWTAVNANP